MAIREINKGIAVFQGLDRNAGSLPVFPSLLTKASADGLQEPQRQECGSLTTLQLAVSLMLWIDNYP